MTSSELLQLSGVGPAQAAKLAVLGVTTIKQLLDFYPRRYDDYSLVLPIDQLHPGAVTIEAPITKLKSRYVRRGLHITEAEASDGKNAVKLVWFNQPYRAAAIKSGQAYFISGQYELSRQRFSIMNPSVEMVSDLPTNTARILAVYRETKGLTSRQIRLAVRSALALTKDIPETLPSWLITSQKLVSRASAIESIHLPKSAEDLAAARQRLGFEEVFHLTLASLYNKLENQSEVSEPITFKVELAKDFVKNLPFKLTDAQRKSIWQIYQDLEKPQPMNRLIEGDVGAGKTVVATMASLMVLEASKQVAFMAPTELLARQHAETIHNLLKPLGLDQRLVLLVGSMNPTQKAKAREAIASGQAGLIIGTQALIQEKINMHNLSLIIIDEQQRFGVVQRKTLMSKAGHMPHVLSLTATPIPRTLALTLYGELDISVLDQKPPGRQPIITEIISPNSTSDLYKKIDQQLATGQQMFVVCPLITDSSQLDASSAESVYAELSKKHFVNRRVGLLHGKLKDSDKQRIMTEFINHQLDILVATTVIEVGVDVPDASIMLIESPERFGLAQLHQLRGRVGRGQYQGYCYLMLSDSNQPSRRLRALTSSNDGFKLAELDLEIRGPGAIYGTDQHGALDLRIAKLKDTALIAAARASAQKFIDNQENLLQYTELATSVSRLRTVTNLN